MRVNGSKWLFIFLLLFSLIAGTFIGEILGSYFPIFSKGFDFHLFNQGSGNWIIDLHFVKVNLGLYMKINLGGILFLIAGIVVLYKK